VVLASAGAGAARAGAAPPAYQTRDLTPPGVGAAIQEVAGGRAAGYLIRGNKSEAAVWDLASGTHTNIHPDGWDHSYGYGLGSGGQVVGLGLDYSPVTRIEALLWNGATNQAAPLHPGAATSSSASDTDGVNQVGGATFPVGGNRAILWRGSANDYVDLTPYAQGFTAADAIALDRGRQVGYGTRTVDGQSRTHALLWSGTAASAVDLHPAGEHNFISYANEIRGNQQVGYAGGPTIGHVLHATLWEGTAESAVDLHPEGYRSSNATATNGVQQAGVAAGLGGGVSNRAMVWSGTADSAVDLHQFLGADFVTSYANAIDDAGNVYGEAMDSSGRIHAMVWSPVVPEPSATAAALLASAVLTLWSRPRRAGRRANP
jgi:hypothetical protein